MKRCICLLVFSLAPHLAPASTFYVLLSSDPEAPTPEAVVFEASISPRPPGSILPAFNAQAPDTVDYLIHRRATGNLRTLMDNSLDWAATKLQQYIVVTYGETVAPVDIVAS